MTETRRPWYRRAFPVLGLGGLVVITGGTGWLVDQGVERIVVPRQYAAELWMNEITGQPEAYGFALRKFTVATSDGLTLEAMMAVPGAAAGTTARGQAVRAALKQAGLREYPDQTRFRGTLILLHGFNARKEHMLRFAERFCAVGFRCVFYDSRGHGDSGGGYATFGIREIDDLKRVIAAVRPLAGAGGLGPLGMLGYSMGGAVALQAQPELPEIQALATVSTFADFREVIARQAAGRWEGLGKPLLALVRRETQWVAGFDPWEVRPVHSAARLTCPLFLAHGDQDALIPVSHLHQLAKAAGTHVKVVMEVPGGTHGGVFIAGGEALWGALAVFFVQELPRNGP